MANINTRLLRASAMSTMYPWVISVTQDMLDGHLLKPDRQHVEWIFRGVDLQGEVTPPTSDQKAHIGPLFSLRSGDTGANLGGTPCGMH